MYLGVPCHAILMASVYIADTQISLVYPRMPCCSILHCVWNWLGTRCRGIMQGYVVVRRGGSVSAEQMSPDGWPKFVLIMGLIV